MTGAASGSAETATDRGQVYTLEGVVASLLVVSAVLLALQSVALAPTTTGTVDAEARQQLHVQTSDLLVAAHERGLLAPMLRNWNTTGRVFYDQQSNTSRRFGYGAEDPPGEFGGMLEQTFEQRAYSFNVYVEHLTDGDGSDVERTPLVVRGEPTANAVESSITVTLFDDDTVVNLADDGSVVATGPSLGSLNDSEFYADDVDPGPMYNVLRIRVVVW
jgi:hypothetical protein